MRAGTGTDRKSGATPAASTADTVQRMLDAAEVLFAEHGFAGTSLRMITQRASVNLASVNYHFGSKEALLQEVFSRRLDPLVQQCCQRLLQQQAAGPVPVASAMAIFLETAQQQVWTRGRDGGRFVRLLSRAFIEPHPALQGMLPKHFAPLVMAYKTVLREALPQLDEATLMWRLHLAFGTLFHALAGNDALQMVARCETVDADDQRMVMQQILPFLSGGMQAGAG